MKNHLKIFGIIALAVIVFSMAGCPQPVGKKTTPTPDTYSIALTDSVGEPLGSTYNFTSITAITVKVVNTGNKPTGALSIGTGTSTSYTLSTTSITNIQVGATATFTVVPKNVLTSGLHEATVTVSGDNGITASFDVTYTASDAPSYGINLNNGTLTEHDFGSSRTPLYVTVTNSGNRETGALSIAITGDDAEAFMLSTTSLTSIGTDGGNRTFQVTPNSEYVFTPEQEYSAIVTVSGDENITDKIFTVKYTEPLTPYYGVALSYVGGDLIDYEFTDITPLEVTVVNSGTAATGDLDITIDGDDTAFELSVISIDDIAVGNNDTFTVTPVSGLVAGIYTATITVSGNNGIEARFDVTYTLSINNILNGLWWNEAVITNTSGAPLGGGNAPGVWVFDYPNAWNLATFGAARKGTFTIGGTENSGTYVLSRTGQKPSDGSWAAYDPPNVWTTQTWALSNGGNTLTITVPISGSNEVLELTRINWHAPETISMSSPDGDTWQRKIGDSNLDAIIPLPSAIADNALIDGLWVNLTMIQTSGTPGVWVFKYPNYWRLNTDGEVWKGTFVLNGSVDSTNSRRFTLNQTRQKTSADSYNWVNNASQSFRDWHLSNDDKLYIGHGSSVNSAKDAFVRMNWSDPANSAGTNKGPWETKIGDTMMNFAVINPPSFSSYARLQVNSFTTADPYASDVSSTGASVTSSVADGVWSISYDSSQAYNAYGRIWLSNVLNANSKSITDIIGVSYKQKSTGNINETVTYVREASNSRTFNVSNIIASDEWTEIFVPVNCATLINTNNDRRLAIGVTGVGGIAGTLYIKDLYFYFAP